MTLPQRYFTSNKEVFLVPAMNVRIGFIKLHREFRCLIEYGYKFIGPENGEMACGEYGKGKMSVQDRFYLWINF